MTDLDYTEGLVADTVDEHGAVHGVTNFAGILRGSMVSNMDESEVDAVVDVRLKGHFCLIRAASAHWRERYKTEGFDRQRSFCCVSSGAAVATPARPTARQRRPASSG